MSTPEPYPPADRPTSPIPSRAFTPGASTPGTPSPRSPTPLSPRLASDSERVVSIFAHLSAIIAAIVSVGWLSILGPLVVYVVYKDRSPLVRSAAAGAFNFNLAIWAMIVVGWVCVLSVVLLPIGVILWIIAAVAGLVCHLLGAVRANRGQPYTYPFSIRVLS